MEKRDKKEQKGSWTAKLFFLLSLAVFSYVVYSATKVFYKKNQVQREISGLQEEAARIERENSELREKVSYFESKDFQEKEVRDKLNLQSPDENLVIVKPGPAKEKEPEPIEIKEEKEIINKNPIYKKWWNYFFKY